MVERVSVIATVLNESATIVRLLGSLAGQTRRPDEVVIVDGGSRDGTLAALRTFAESAPFEMQILDRPGANISQGRNMAISVATCTLIAATDAGVRLEPDWLEKLIAPFFSDPAPDVVSGFFEPEYTTLFERVLGAVTLPALAEIDPERFYPSSRSVAFRREAWERVGGYPEWLDYCEDLVFDFCLRDAGCSFGFAPEALVHFRPRGTLKAYLKQYYRYARGDGKARLWRYRHLVRYGMYLGAAPLAIALTVWRPIGWLALLVVLAALARSPLRRLRAHLGGLSFAQKIEASLLAVGLRIAGDFAKMIGYPVGVVWRLRHAPAVGWSTRDW